MKSSSSSTVVYQHPRLAKNLLHYLSWIVGPHVLQRRAMDQQKRLADVAADYVAAQMLPPLAMVCAAGLRGRPWRWRCR